MGKRKSSKRENYFFIGFMALIVIVILLYGLFFLGSNKVEKYMFGKAIANNNAPTIDSIYPKREAVILMETETYTFLHNSSDADGDSIDSYWKLDNGSWVERWNYIYTAREVKNHTLTLRITDGIFNDSYSWTIVVNRYDTSPRLKQNIPYIEIEVNRELEDYFDLDSFFEDPQNKRLIYSVRGNENIDIKINFASNKVSFYPKKDWIGSEEVYFVADDKTLSTKSNNITITVVEEECIEAWTCTDWRPNECPYSEVLTRVCSDAKRCGTTNYKPEVSKSCVYVEEIEVDTQLFGNNDEVFSKQGESQELLSPEEDSGIDSVQIISILVSAFILGGLIGLVVYETTKSKKNLEKEKKSGDVGGSTLARLMDYIRREISQGKSEQEIRTKLLFEGWNEYIVNKAFSQLESMIEEAHGNDNIDTIVRKHVDKDVHDKMKAFD